jgi:hypothetical protein
MEGLFNDLAPAFMFTIGFTHFVLELGVSPQLGYGVDAKIQELV